MARRRKGRLLPNENREFVLGVLEEVKALKEAYESAPATMDRCDQLVASIYGRLKTDEVARAFNPLLRDEYQRVLADALVNVPRSDLEDEIELAQDFGYSGKDVKRYVRRARPAARPANGRSIATTDDLVRELEALHSQAKRDLFAVTGPPWKRWSALRHARAAAQYRLYCVGTIVADGMVSDLFETSYAIGTSGLGT